jgi:hypothetical protein
VTLEKQAEINGLLGEPIYTPVIKTQQPARGRPSAVRPFGHERGRMTVNLSDLFIGSTRADDPINSNMVGSNDPPKQIADLLTLQSLSFPIVSGSIGVAWKVLQKSTGADWTKGGLVPIGLAVIVVIGLWLNGYTELGSPSKRLAALAIGVINALLLAAGALGVSTSLPI